MATMAAIRTASSVCAPSLASSSSAPHSSSDCRNAPQIFATSSLRPSVFLLSQSSSSSSAAATTSGLSLSSCSIYSRSISKLLKEVKSRGGRRDARNAGLSASPRCEAESNTDGKVPFGYTRKDVILIGVGLVGFGYALKYGLEFFGVDSIKAGNAVQLIMVLGLTIGWISTYVFRVSSKEMTYAKQLKDYENKVMQKRLEEMPEAELESMLAQIEEEKKRLRENREKLL